MSLLEEHFMSHCGKQCMQSTNVEELGTMQKDQVMVLEKTIMNNNNLPDTIYILVWRNR
jgi:hypothetical protein